jgi:uncharacterized protein YutD
MDKETLERDIQWLLENPGMNMGSSYHDAGKCWRLIEVLVDQLRDHKFREVRYQRLLDRYDNFVGDLIKAKTEKT